MIEPRLRNHVLHSRSAHATSQGAFEALNVLQNIEHPADQALGLACALKYVAKATGHHPIELLKLVDRMEADCRFREVNTLAAVERYADEEIGKKLR